MNTQETLNTPEDKPTIEGVCTYCEGLGLFTQKEIDNEGRYCPKCWDKELARDPLSDEEKKVLKEPLHVAQMRKILVNGSAGVMCPVNKKRIAVDAFSASAFVQVWDAINEVNKIKMAKMSIPRAMDVVWKITQTGSKLAS